MDDPSYFAIFKDEAFELRTKKDDEDLEKPGQQSIIDLILMCWIYHSHTVGMAKKKV